ncbi:MAG: cytochrome c oxidase accessory protein CcoG [Myxococcota bacterium]
MANPPLLRPEKRVLPTLNEDGTRRWLKPKHAPGRYDRARKLVGWSLIVLFVGLPFLRVGGYPAVWLNLPARQFVMFGKVFLATDTEVLLLGMLSVFVAVFLLSALLGRVWCGWGCPQTVYMELVYRPIERFADRMTKRSRGRRQGLATTLKYVAFLLVSMGLAHTFLAYFVSVDELAVWMLSSPFEQPVHFLIMAGTVGLMMFDFAYFREQMCTVVCPYARLQSALLDKHSLIVGFDRRRAEPRGKGAAKELKRKLPMVQRRHGDCIDCSACVAACPAGIDIRDGLQLECIACAQCVDACDNVMQRLGAPTGLIRYSSQAALEDGEETKLLRVRTVVYPLLLVGLLGGLAVAVASHGASEVEVLRGTGAPFTVESNVVRNQVRVRVANRTDETQRYTIEVMGPEGTELIAPINPLPVAPHETESAQVFVLAPQGQFVGGDLQVKIVVSSGEFREERPFRLLGPMGSGVVRAGKVRATPPRLSR